MDSFNTIVNIGFWALLLALPGLLGVVIGAPLIARELESGTWQLAWAQTVPRTRWLITKLAVVAAGLVILGAAMTALITWYRQPMDRLTGHFINNVYDFEGLALTAYILLAFGLAVLAGLLIRRSIPAMVAALIAWLAVRLTVEYLLRPRFQTPLTLRQNCAHGCSVNVGITSVPPQTGHIGDWVLRTTGPGNQIMTTYQPADRFWTFQLIEAGLIVAITAAALGATIWLLHRRAGVTASGRRVVCSAARTRGQPAMLRLSVVDGPVADRADHGRVAVVEEQGGAGVHGGDAGHLVAGEGEVEDVEVLRHPLGSNRFGDAMGGADLGQGGVGEQVVAAFGEPAPGLVLDAALDHEVMVGVPLEVGVGLDLVDCRGDPGAVDEVHERVGVEVGDADGLSPGRARGGQRMARQEP